jgi:flavin reductase (DIM6/NTAB) family NADH-FMN oxidoreductase RutF
VKKSLGPVNALYPSLTTILGAVVDGRPNFLAIAHVGIMNHGTPQYLSFGVNKIHYTNRGIHEHGEFSVNLPSEPLMSETDYVGMVSGKNTDKSGLFEIFWGELKNAPMIQECPVTMECRLKQVVDFETHDVFVGEIVQTYANEEVLKESGKIDVTRVRPLLFDMNSVRYYGLGPELGACWNVGKKHKK